MRIVRWMGVLILTGLVNVATAQVVPPPLSATVINFDDVTEPDSLPASGPLTTEYSGLGITFAGFGHNGGARTQFFGSVPTGAASLPNVLYFIGIGTMQSGGLQVSPEFITFDPPIGTLQFDLTTLGFDCEGTEAVTAQAFAADGTLVDEKTTVIPLEGITVKFDPFTTPVEQVVVTSTQTCGTSFLKGVELFTIDNIAFTPAASGTGSDCASLALNAATNKTKAKTKCYSQAVAKGLPVDDKCIQKANDKFTKDFARAVKKNDCVTDADAPSIEATVDQFISDVNNQVNGSAPGPDVCDSKKIAAAGKKSVQVGSCFSRSARNGTATDDACVQKAADEFVKSLKKCSTPDQSAPLETLIDNFVRTVSRAVAASTTTTTTTTTSTTTTTTAPPLGLHVTFTSSAGTANCGGRGTPADPPLSGAVYSDVDQMTSIADLGLACLYIGGGNGNIAASQLPENAQTILDTPDAQALMASFGTGPRDCTKGPAATKHCLNNLAVECTTDDDCFLDGACQPDANCFFGPPVPVNGFPASCVVNAFASDASGMINLGGPSASLSIQLSSRVFISTLNQTACPQCIGNVCTFGQNAGGACETNNVNMTSLDCPPTDGTYIATLPINLSPLTTGEALLTATDGLFCPGQINPGAFSLPDARAIRQQGSLDLGTMESTLVSIFCIPSTGSASLDNLADLPGPGTLSLPGVTMLVPPSP